MRRRNAIRTLTATGAALALLVAPVAAAPVVKITEATANGGTATVRGTTEFPPITAAQPVGGTVTLGTVGGTPAAGPAGLVLTGAKIQPLPNGGGLRFIWELSDMPAQVPPEGVRYNWSFTIGGRVYQLQAKRTNLASVTTVEDPVNHVQQVQKGEFFQLRGACVSQYMGTPVSGCYHLAFVNGSFDVGSKRVMFDLPFQTRDSIGRLVAPDFKPGAALVAAETASSSIVAGAQAVVSTRDTGSYINGWNTYYVGPQVHVGVGWPNSDPAEVEYTETAALAPDGTFTGTVSGLTSKATTVYVRACDGAECSYDAFVPTSA